MGWSYKHNVCWSLFEVLPQPLQSRIQWIAREAHLLLGQISFIFMQVLAKILPNSRYLPPIRGLAAPSGDPPLLPIVAVL